MPLPYRRAVPTVGHQREQPPAQDLLHPYLRAYDGVSASKTDIAQFIDWYNTGRPHSSLDDQTPEQTYWALLPAMQAPA